MARAARDRPLGAIVLFIVALAVYGVRAIGWPLIAGRDLDEYLYGYIQFLDWHPLLPWSMLFRTPVTPVVGHGARRGGGLLRRAAARRRCSRGRSSRGPRPLVRSARCRAARGAVAVLVYPAYGLMFHELSSEPLFAAAFALWAWLVTRAAGRPSPRGFALAGLGVALLALIRPGNAVLLAFVVFAMRPPGRRRTRAKWAGAFLVAGVVPLAAWAVLNGARFGDYTLARGGNAVIPFYRAFISDKIVSPNNGPASRRLADAIQRRLLTRDPYKAYGVTVARVFSSGSFRIHEDLYLLSDQVFGWNSNYSILRDAGREAVRAHPGKYTSGVSHTVWQQLSKSYFRSPPSQDSRPAARLGRPARRRRPRRESRSRPARTSGSPAPTTASATSGRRRPTITSSSESRRSNRGSTQSFASATALFRALPHRQGNASSDCASTSSRAGSRAPISGSRSA